ncbi:MAG: tetratricopeptide repeat protein [Xanthomonadales bacterium]|nr:tetratricopeptide repeat protein [Xanthomonadales bacterium]
MKRLPSVLVFTIVLLTACTTVNELPVEPPSKPLAVASDIASPEAPLRPTDPEVMNHVFAAEVLGSEGDYSAAAAEYLEAALISADPEIAKRAARVAVSAGEWQMVALASDRWAMLDSSSLEAREMAAGSRLREGDYAGAEYQLARILDLTSSDLAHGWQVVTALLVPASDQARANKVLENLSQQFDADNNVDALFARSQFAARMGNLEQAGEFIETAIGLEPGRADLLAWSGRVAINLDKLDMALERYRQAWQAEPQDPQYAMAYAELLKRNNDAATGQAVMAQLPDTPGMRFARIVYALDTDDRESAEKLYAGFSEEAYSDAPDMAFHAAQSAELLDYKRQAIDWYGQVTGEQSLRSVLRRALLLAELGEVGDARNLLVNLRVNADASVRSQSYQIEAQILNEAGDPEEAMRVLGSALLELPADFQLRYARALLAVAQGRLQLAESDLRQLIAEQPQNAVAINALGYTLADMTDRFEEAEQLIHQAYALQPDDPSIIDSMGWIAYRRGRMTEAEKFLREAWDLLRNAEVAAHLGEVLWVNGRQDEARSLWESGLELDSDNRVLRETMQRFGESH